MRWLCRCYESTGQKGEDNPDPASWYTVVSEEEKTVGGPTTNGLDLSAELESAMVDGMQIEHKVFESGEWFDASSIVDSPAGYKECLVWIFTFYGHVVDCETTYTGIPTYHESADDCYTIVPCQRCKRF
jgi:hypothetical protein